MMEITCIKRSKNGNAVVYVDGEYACALSPEVLVKSGLKVGLLIDEDSLLEAKRTFDDYKAKEKALCLLSLRAHSKKELETKIKRSSGEESAQKAVQNMERLGLVNDAQFAKMYADELRSRKLYSLSRIKYEILQKGVERETVEQVIEEMDGNDEENYAKKFLENRYSGKLCDDKARRKAICALKRLGYGWSQINSALKGVGVSLEDDF